MTAITDTIKSTIPKHRPFPYAKRWWSKELLQKCKGVQKLGRRSYTKRGDLEELAHKAYKAARNEYGTMITTAKKFHWEEFLQTVDDKSIWTAHRYALGDPTDGSKTRVPTLKLGRHEDGMTNEAVSNEDKDKTFAKTFFSSPGVETLPSDDYEYPTPKFIFSPILNLQIT